MLYHLKGKILKNFKLKRTSVHVKPRAILCTATYEAASTVEVWSLCSLGSTCTESTEVDMSKKSIKGTVGEHKVIVQLLEDGYHVAKAVDPQCPFDLVAVGEEGDVKLIDVKTISYRKNTKLTWTKKSKKINRVPTTRQKKMKIELVMVD